MTEPDRPIAGLDVLPYPAPRDGFWEDLRTQLRAEDNRSQHPTALAEPVVEIGRGGRRGWLVAAVGLGFLGAGLVGVASLRDGPPDNADGRRVVVADPLAIDLDPWATHPPHTAPGPFAVFDLDALPAGWAVADRGAGYHELFDDDPDHYRWTARVLTDDGRSVWLGAGRDGSVMPPASDVAIDGRPGRAYGDTLEWMATSDVHLSVISADATPEQLVAIAESLDVVEIDVLPPIGVGSEAAASAGEVRLRGHLDGIAWTVATAPDARAGIGLDIDGASVGSSSADVSHLNDSGATWNLDAAGFGAHGSIVYGVAPAVVERVDVVLDDATTVSLPVARDENGAAVFAVPIPTGLRIDELRLTDALGVVLHRAIGPNPLLPAAGGGAYYDRTFGSVDEPLDIVDPD